MKALLIVASLLVPLSAPCTASDIKALGEEEQAALRAGKGMGFAKAAELNGYPGPLHVLELADQLELSTGQATATRALFERMQSAARGNGAALIEAERSLDALYASRSATPDKVMTQLAKIEALRTALRAVHLNAHLEQSTLLTPAQVHRYQVLRGYRSAGHAGH